MIINFFKRLKDTTIRYNNHCKMLELNIFHTLEERKANYMRLILENHPDKGGDIDKIKELTLAYRELNTNKPKP